MESALLSVLRIAGPAVLAVCLWAVWIRRDTFGSRFDSTGTLAAVLFGAGSALDAPWWATAEALSSETGKFYVLKLLAGLCYITGAGLTVSVIYRRLLPDDAIGPFVRKWIGPLVISAGVVMVVCFLASDVTSTLSAVHPYLVRPDGWMTVYWLAHFGTTTALGVVASYGVYHLRRDPRSVWLNVGLASLLTAAVFGGVAVGYAVITGHLRVLMLVGWLLTYAAFAVAAIGSALQWQHRKRLLRGREGQVQ